jgi:F-type H+-transporting ATPase subunit epsilon
MQLQIVTPEGEKLSTDVTEVTAPGVLGELGILPGHVPVLTVLDIGQFTYVAGGSTKKMALGGGYLEVDNDTLVVITESAEHSDEIDAERARAALAAAEKSIAELDENDSAVERALRKKRRAEVRLAVAGN